MRTGQEIGERRLQCWAPGAFACFSPELLPPHHLAPVLGEDVSFFSFPGFLLLPPLLFSSCESAPTAVLGLHTSVSLLVN